MKTASCTLGRGGPRGFTLIELLVVIAIIAILAGMLLSALAKAKTKGQGIVCLNHLRTLILCWQMYAHDHGDRLVTNLGMSDITANPNRTDGWITGVLDYDGSNSDNTNRLFLTDRRFCRFADYNGSAAGIYKCPADKSWVSLRGRRHDRVRSLAMNNWVNGREWWDNIGQGYTKYENLTDVRRPASIWVFGDEHEDSINDGSFGVSMNGHPDRPAEYKLEDYPASYHSGAGGFSFADGHAEIHKWLDHQTKIRVSRVATTPRDTPHNLDVAWLHRHTTEKR